jgi:hypothetical protein
MGGCLWPYRVKASPQMRPHQRARHPAVIRHLEMQQLVDDDLRTEVRGLAEQIVAKGDATVRGAARALSGHRANAYLFRLHADPASPGPDFRAEEVRWDRGLERIGSRGTVDTHRDPRSMFRTISPRRTDRLKSPAACAGRRPRLTCGPLVLKVINYRTAETELNQLRVRRRRSTTRIAFRGARRRHQARIHCRPVACLACLPAYGRSRGEFCRLAHTASMQLEK